MSELLNDPIDLAVSSCLTGDAVRYDGSDCYNTIILSDFSQYFNLQRICPEVAIGLGVPRDPIQIIQDRNKSEKFYLVGKKDHALNYTNRMLSYTKLQINCLKWLCGYVTKERSPSCGLAMTPRYSYQDDIVAFGAGVYIEQLMHNLPWLPILTEFGLDNDDLRDNFLERLFIMHLWHLNNRNNRAQNTFADCIEHQLEIRINDKKSLDELLNKKSKIPDKNYIINAMTILKSPVTLSMQANFLSNQLQKFGLVSDHMSGIILDYQNHKLSLLFIITEFQKLFKANNIQINSNYFYPDKREIKSREMYFGTL